MLQVPNRPSATDGALNRSGVLALAGCVLLLTVIGAASLWQSQRNAVALASSQAMRTERNLVAAVQLAVADAETAQRGYLLTFDPAYLGPFERAEAELPGLFRQLSQTRSADPRIQLLQQVVSSKMAELRQTVALARAGDGAGALAVVKTNAGAADMAAIRAGVTVFEAELDATLAEQQSAITHGGRLLVAIDVAGLLMIVALAGLIALGLRSYVARLRQAQTQTAAAYDALERTNERLDERVRIRTAELTAANDEIQRFAYIVSHDLRAPLVNIMGFTSELEQATGVLAAHALTADSPAEIQEAARDEIPEALRFIKTSTAKMDRLINAILKLSREGRRPLASERLDMPAIMRGLVDTMQHQIESNGARVTVGTMPNVIGDPMCVEQSFGNVLENALKYLQPGRPGVITVSGRMEGGMARYDIADNGRGIAAKDFERVFELFRRAGDQTVPGEGIGLAHVRALMRRMGGRIDCESQLGTGTTFILRLPPKPPASVENVA